MNKNNKSNLDDKIKEIENAILDGNIVYFEQPIKEYRKLKIKHLSILGFAIYHSDSVNLIENIIKQNAKMILPIDIEEDGFKTFVYIFDSQILSLEQKKKILDLFKTELREDFEYTSFSVDFVGYCIAINQIPLLLHLFKTYLKDDKEDLKIFYQNMEDRLLSNHDFDTLHELKHFLEID